MNTEEEIKNKYNLNFTRKRDLEKLKECLTSVLSFVFCDSQYQQTEIDMDFSFKKPNFIRQKILREQRILDLLAQVLDNAFPNKKVLQKVIYCYFF